MSACCDKCETNLEQAMFYDDVICHRSCCAWQKENNVKTLKSAFCTTAPIQPQGHGGGSSSYYELQALKGTTEVEQIIQHNPVMANHYPGNMFMMDYEASLRAEPSPDVAIFNGGPWSATMRALKAHKNIVDCPAHNLKHSMEEHIRLMGKYPYVNMTDPHLKQMQFRYLKDADVIIVQAAMSLQWLADLGVHPPRAYVIPGGCHYPETIPPIPERFGVGYLGAFGADKGIDYLINAWADGGHKDADLILAGSGSVNIRSDDLKSWNNYASIKSMGRVDNLEDFWKQVSVYVQPSVTEGFGLPVLEAMSYGRPVIVTQGTGASEIAKHGEDGLIIPIRNKEAIIDSIRWFMAHPGEVARMGAHARETAKKYTWDIIQKEYEKVILS